MSRWLRSAEVNKGLITVLVVLVIVAGLIWGYRWYSHKKELGEIKPSEHKAQIDDKPMKTEDGTEILRP